jgi:hypothetical protein
LENVKIEGNNNNNNEVYFTAVECEGFEKAHLSQGMSQKRTFMDMLMISGGLMMRNF